MRAYTKGHGELDKYSNLYFFKHACIICSYLNSLLIKKI